jgi:hypothetical protein
LPLLASSPVSAATVLDPTGDFLPTFAGPHDADLDVTSFSVDFNEASSTFLLGASLAGPVNPATPGIYVIGVNTGTGTLAPFSSIGEPNVTFNQAIAIQKNGTAMIGQTVLPSAATIVGNMFSATVPLSFLPSTGATPQTYGFNLWPRTAFGNNNQISDFAPENALLRVAAVPEPSTWAMLLAGFAAIGMAMRRKKAPVTRRRVRLA